VNKENMNDTATANSEKDRKFNKAKLLKNSCRLNLYKHSNYPEIVSVVDHLCDEMIKAEDISLIKKSSLAKMKYHMEFFVINLYKVYVGDPTKVISYSRDKGNYSDKKSRYVRKFKLSYRYSVEAGKNGKGVINFLEKQNYIETFSFQYNKVRGGSSFQSRMRATRKLIDLIEEKYAVSAVMFDLDRSKDETVIMKGVKPKPIWVMEVNKDGRKIRKKKQRKRKICKTPDKPIVREMRVNLKVLNDVMDKADISLDISKEEVNALNIRMLNDPDPYKQAIDFSRKHLYRVFLDRRLDLGGRFYGPWYQNIPKEYREHILINGIPTLELDYSALHPNLLYYFAKANPPAGDLYQLDGYSKETRNFLKGAFLRLINSSSRNDAKGSIREAAFKHGKISVPAELGNLEDRLLDPLIDKFLEKHKALNPFIFKAKNLGNRLQNVDSMIAEKVLLYFALQGIPVLPLHDGFRISAEMYPKLEEVMHRVVTENFGRDIWISNDEYPLLAMKLFDMIAEGIDKGEHDEQSLNTLFNDIEQIIKRAEGNLEKAKVMKNRKAVN
jgi:hypothetical protein